MFDHMLERIDTGLSTRRSAHHSVHAADGDGKISRDEWIARYGNADGFDQYDLDGVIDANEFRMVHAAEIDFSRLE